MKYPSKVKNNQPTGTKTISKSGNHSNLENLIIFYVIFISITTKNNEFLDCFFLLRENCFTKVGFLLHIFLKS